MSHPLAMVVAAALIVIGLALAGYGLLLWLRIRNLRQRGFTNGIVVDNEVTSYSRGRLSFRPVVRFSTPAGREVTFVGAQGRSRSYVEGSRLAVVYDPADPNRAAVGTGGAALGYLSVGLLIAASGIVWYVVMP
jgi:hypothetical protein